jgi:hypothetical protein
MSPKPDGRQCSLKCGSLILFCLVAPFLRVITGVENDASFPCESVRRKTGLHIGALVSPFSPLAPSAFSPCEAG